MNDEKMIIWLVSDMILWLLLNMNEKKKLLVSIGYDFAEIKQGHFNSLSLSLSLSRFPFSK